MITAPDALTLTPLAPLLSLLVAGAVALLVGVASRDVRPAGAIALVGLVVAAAFAGVNLAGAQDGPTSAFGLQWIVDAPSAALTIAILIGAFLAILIGWDALE